MNVITKDQEQLKYRQVNQAECGSSLPVYEQVSETGQSSSKTSQQFVEVATILMARKYICVSQRSCGSSKSKSVFLWTDYLD